jgi:aryl-phospho-beta-D-glucosidase BglC (GH1 family)
LAIGIMGCCLACSNSGPLGPASDGAAGRGGSDAAVGGALGGSTVAGGSGATSTGGVGGQNTGGSVAGGAGGSDTGGSGGSDTGGSAEGGAGGSDTGGAGGSDTGGSDTGGSGGGAGSSDKGGSGGTGGADAAAGAPAIDASSGRPDAPSAPTFLHVQGNRLLDAQGKSVRLTGVNWFGLETSNEAPHGTWARDYRSMLKQMRDLGFNSLRLPYSNAILRPDAKAQSVTTIGKDPYDGTDPMNGPLAGKTPLEMMDLVIAAAGDVGLKIILDNHSREPDAYDKEELWYSAKTPESLWISDWVSLAKRYSGNTTVVAFDLDNEPHGASTWGTGGATDWNSAAERCGNAVLAVNPDVLIIVEGVSIIGTDVYWWGGNLSAVRTAPIHLSKPEKLVYSAHEYGPEVHDQTWFTDATFPASLAPAWDKHFDFIMTQGLGHLLLGEFGIKDRAAFSGKSGVWFDTLLKTVGSTYSWTFWCWNPNSGDTEGILQTDWLTPQQWKMDALKPYLAPMIGK